MSQTGLEPVHSPPMNEHGVDFDVNFSFGGSLWLISALGLSATRFQLIRIILCFYRPFGGMGCPVWWDGLSLHFWVRVLWVGCLKVLRLRFRRGPRNVYLQSGVTVSLRCQAVSLRCLAPPSKHHRVTLVNSYLIFLLSTSLLPTPKYRPDFDFFCHRYIGFLVACAARRWEGTNGSVCCFRAGPLVSNGALCPRTLHRLHTLLTWSVVLDLICSHGLVHNSILQL